jgi:hypothetical protein
MRRLGRVFVVFSLMLWAAGSLPLAVLGQDTSKKQEKKADTKKKKAEQAPDVGDTSDPAVQRKNLSKVLRALSDSFEGNSPRRLRELLDETFYDFPRFEDQVTEFLRQNSELRMFFRESTSELKGDKATLIVDADMTFAVKDTPSVERKRHQRIQFDFVRTAKGWKIYEITPRSFFTP